MSPANRRRQIVPKTTVCHCLRYSALLFPYLLAVQVAQAGAKDNKDTQDSKERAAKTACLSGDYAKGVAILAELYVRTNDPNHLFNQGRCFEQNGKYSEAIIRFREFLLKNTDAGNTSDGLAEKHIAACQALLDKDKDSTATTHAVAPIQAPALVQSSAEHPALTGPAANAAAALPTPENARPTTAAPGSGLRIAGIATLAVGVAGIAGGIVLNLKANSLADEIETTKPYQRSKENSRASYETLGWVGYGLGAACLAGGAILYYLGYGKDQRASVAFLPTAAPGAAGAVLQGAF